MATKLRNPLRPLREQMGYFAKDAKDQVERNFRTQHIFPNYVYSEYGMVNEQRKRNHQWFSTGEGVRSFHYRNNSSGNTNASITFRYNDYLRFVDMGVSKGNPWGEVVHDAKARYLKRYTRWVHRGGHTHRPAIMMEFRHLQYRMQNYMEDYLGWEGSVMLVNNLMIEE